MIGNSILATTRSKRWNGKIATLAVDYLKEVAQQMDTYGDRVQFALGGALRPHYQVVNRADKAMAFDSNSHLHTPKEGEFDAGNATELHTLEEVQAVIANDGKKVVKPRAPRAPRAAGAAAATRGITAAARAREAVDTEKYAYYKTNRSTLPPAIGEYSEEIAQLMSAGMSAEQAFTEIIKNHF